MRALLIIAFLSIAFVIKSQEKLYFISGTPSAGANIEHQEFYTLLYSYEMSSDSLQVLDTLTYIDNSFLEFIKVYYEQKKIVMYEECKYLCGNQFTFCDFKEFISKDRKSVELKDKCRTSSKENLLRDNGQLLYRMRGQNNLTGISEDYTYKTLDVSNYSNAIIIGQPGGMVEGVEDYLGLVTSKKQISDLLWLKERDSLDLVIPPDNGNLYISKTADMSKRPIFPITLPDSLQVKVESVLINIYNDKVLVLSAYEYHNAKSTSDLGGAKLLIYHRAKKQWKTLDIKGDILRLTSFGSWLTGSVCAGLIDKDSPGREKRNTNICMGKEFGILINNMIEGMCIGIPFDYMNYQHYFPGTLYLYNVETDTYIEWNTGQGDSEILLVRDEIIYYRDNDTIYKRAILNGKELGKPQKLVTSPNVPFIHWAFFID